jgi:hypothetical protein
MRNLHEFAVEMVLAVAGVLTAGRSVYKHFEYKMAYNLSHERSGGTHGNRPAIHRRF